MKAFLHNLILLLAVLTCSCKDTTAGPGEASRARMFLESEYMNNSWGYAHWGWVIDTAGNIVSYDIGKSGNDWRGNPGGYYTEQELLAKVDHCDTLRGSIPSDTLLWLRGLAATVGETYSDTLRVGADMGALVRSCYIFDPDSSKYHQVVLRVTGDYQYHNTSPGAVALADWIDRQRPTGN